MQGVLGLENHMLFLQEDSAIYQKHFYYITAFLHERLCTDFTILMILLVDRLSFTISVKCFLCKM